MTYNEKLAERVRLVLAHLPKVEEKRMFQGMAFMVNDKLCICVGKDEMLCRVDPDIFDELLRKKGCRPMIMKNRQSKSFVYVDNEEIKTDEEFNYWIGLVLEFNIKAKASKKRKQFKTT